MHLPVQNNHTVFWLIGNGVRKEYETLTPEMIEWAKNNKVGIYYTVNELGDKRNENKNLRHRENVTKLLAFFTDFDEGTKEEQKKKILSFPLRPSCIVESGRGYHAYWYLNQSDAIDEKMWTHIQHELALRFGSDTAVKDPARLLRMPGTWHVKEGMEPSMVKILSQFGDIYRVSDFFSHVPQPPRPYVKTTIGRLHGVESIPLTVLTEGKRHEALTRKAATLYCKTDPVAWDALRTEIKSWYLASCHPPKKDMDKEVDAVCNWIEYAEQRKA